MHWVVAYDIRDDRRRRRVEKILRAYGFRVQYSVFECGLGAAHLARLRAALARAIKPDDSVRLYGLCEGCRARTIALPAQRPAPPQRTVVV